MKKTFLNVLQKLRSQHVSVKAVMKQMNAEVLYGGIKQKVNQDRERLEFSQREFIESRGKPENLKKEKECLHEFVSISKAEKLFLKQKSRNQWLNLGDQNNAYFHKNVKIKNARNLIQHLWKERREKVEEVDQIKKVSEDYYQKLLSTSKEQQVDE